MALPNETILNQNTTTLDIFLEPADGARLAHLCGPFNDNLKQLERRLEVEITYQNYLF
ncbi:MAG: PhoH family protein, partial [Moritella sp.]|nr:PhoH family protein [Moritella sp.]